MQEANAVLQRLKSALKPKARAILAPVFKQIRLLRTPDGGLAELGTTPAALITLVPGGGSALDCNAGSGGRI